MEKILDIITAKMQKAFEEAGYEASFGRVTVSNRPDLCEYQCNGALAAAKTYKCAPIQIAKSVAEKLDDGDFAMIDAVMPGFINLKLSDTFLRNYLEEMRNADSFRLMKPGMTASIMAKSPSSSFSATAFAIWMGAHLYCLAAANAPLH